LRPLLEDCGGENPNIYDFSLSDSIYNSKTMGDCPPLDSTD